MNQNKICAHALFALGIAASLLPVAQAAPIIDLRITGGAFHMGVFTPTGALPYSFTDTSYNIITDFPTPIGWDTTQSHSTAQTGSVVSFAFGTPFVNTFNVVCDPQVVDDCINFPHTQASGTVNGTSLSINDGDPITVDINGLYANWNGVNFNQGGTTGAGTAYPTQPFAFPFTSTVSNVDSIAGTFDYDMTYQSLIVGGPFNGQIGTWRFTGTGVVDLTVPPNNPKTDAGLTLSPNNFASIMLTSTQVNASFPLPTTHDPCTDCWDWMVTGLAMNGDSARVVLPLSSGFPAGGEILKYDSATMTWVPYDTSGGDSVSSAPLLGGTCPNTGDASYVSPPQTGDVCLQLDSTDGAANDDSGLDSIIIDPGGIFVPLAVNVLTPISNNSACSMSNPNASPAHAADWLLLAGFLGWLGMKRRKSD